MLGGNWDGSDSGWLFLVPALRPGLYCTCCLQDPMPVCTPTFLERRKSQVMEVSEDKDNEIVFKLPVPPVKEDSQKTPTPASSGKKRPRKRKSEQ